MTVFDITLPSGGVLYSDKLPGGKLKLSSLTAHEQFIMANEGTDPMVKLNEVLKSCTKDNPISAEELLISDRAYIFIVLRIRSFPKGNEYPIPMRCGSCRFQYIHNVDLTRDIQVQVYEKEPSDPEEGYVYIDPKEISEPMSLILPISKDELSYRFLRGKDESIIAAESKRFAMRSVDLSDPSHIRRFSLMIQKVNGEELKTNEKYLYIQNMEAGDLNALNEDVEYNESGSSMLITTTCNKCGYSEEVPMPFTAEFFRPRSSKKRRGR